MNYTEEEIENLFIFFLQKSGGFALSSKTDRKRVVLFPSKNDGEKFNLTFLPDASLIEALHAATSTYHEFPDGKWTRGQAAKFAFHLSGDSQYHTTDCEFCKNAGHSIQIAETGGDSP